MAWLGRFLSCVLLLLMGPGQALPSLHHLLVEHVVCAEHGELTHAGHHDAGSTPAKKAEPAPGAAAEPAPAAEEHAHEHCSASAPSVPSSLAASETRTSEFAGRRLNARVAPCAERAQSSLELLAFAPKLAPPV